jgi:hypothetical protein
VEGYVAGELREEAAGACDEREMRLDAVTRELREQPDDGPLRPPDVEGGEDEERSQRHSALREPG